MTDRLVVIGGDAAGMSAVSQARRRLGRDQLEIVVFERGHHTSYSACGIPYLVGDGTGFAVHTRWIDDEFLPAAATAAPGDGALPAEVTIQFGGRPYTVALPGLPLLEGPSAASVLAGIRARSGAAGDGRRGGPAVV
jgi:hypothetical protein